MTQNRKRGRNLYQDEVEFVPLSKRINNLHLNGSMFLENQNMANQPLQGIGWDPGPPQFSNIRPELSYSSPTTSSPEPVLNMSFDNSEARYNPDLTESENPHYFYKNKLLFEMHMARMQRNTPNY